MKNLSNRNENRLRAKRKAFLDITEDARRTKTRNYLLIEKSLTTLLKQK